MKGAVSLLVDSEHRFLIGMGGVEPGRLRELVDLLLERHCPLERDCILERDCLLDDPCLGVDWMVESTSRSLSSSFVDSCDVRACWMTLYSFDVSMNLSALVKILAMSCRVRRVKVSPSIPSLKRVNDQIQLI